MIGSIKGFLVVALVTLFCNIAHAANAYLVNANANKRLYVATAVFNEGRSNTPAGRGGYSFGTEIYESWHYTGFAVVEPGSYYVAPEGYFYVLQENEPVAPNYNLPTHKGIALPGTQTFNKYTRDLSNVINGHRDLIREGFVEVVYQKFSGQIVYGNDFALKAKHVSFDHRSRDLVLFNENFYVPQPAMFVENEQYESVGLESRSFTLQGNNVRLSGVLKEGNQEYLFGPRQQSYYVGSADIFYLVRNNNSGFNLTQPAPQPEPGPALAETSRRLGTTYKWKEADGYFVKMGDKLWMEVHPSGQQIYFEEVNDAPMYVEMIDRKRDISVRLYNDMMHLRQPGQSEFRFFRYVDRG